MELTILPQETHHPNVSSATSCCAPAERASPSLLEAQHNLVGVSPLASILLDSNGGYVLILNAQRQIVAAGAKVRELFQAAETEPLLGLRPGEALGCIHSRDCVGGCGTSPHCRECGALKAILGAFSGGRSEHESRLLVRSGAGVQALDFRINGTGFSLGNDRYALISLTDISHEKRRKALEKIFFHDILNLAGGIQGLLDFMKEAKGAPLDLVSMLNLSADTIRDLIEEVAVQRDLQAAEHDELKVTTEAMISIPVLNHLCRTYQQHSACAGTLLKFGSRATIFSFQSSPVLFKRILGNLIKNAAEASSPGSQVTVECWVDDGRAHFTVHNDGVMPQSIQHQIFQRSFSTRGEGRGLGTYSVKLLTEKYLHGSVSFSSEPQQGTVFQVQLPLRVT